MWHLDDQTDSFYLEGLEGARKGLGKCASNPSAAPQCAEWVAMVAEKFFSSPPLTFGSAGFSLPEDKMSCPQCVQPCVSSPICLR